MTRVLVLGGAGFIGYHLIESLVAAGGADITVCDNLFRGRRDAELEALIDGGHVRFIAGDLTEASTFSGLEGTFDEVYLLAGIVGVRYTQERPDLVVYTNASVVLRTLEWIRGLDHRPRLVFTSTSETYAGSLRACPGVAIPTPEDVPLAIEDVLEPRFSYASAKLLGEAAVAAYARVHGIPAVIVRYHNVYGPRMGYEHVVPELSLRLIRREDPFRLYGADQTRAFCYVSDAVAATRAALRVAGSEPQIINVGNDEEEIPIADLLALLLEISGFRPEVITRVPAPKGSPARRCPDLTKARRLLGYEPRVPLREGLRRTFDWYRAQHPDGRPPERRSQAAAAALSGR